MAVSASSFRVDFPEFAATGTYPDSQVNYYLGIALLLFRPERWTTLQDTGVELFVAHNLTLEAKAQAEAANGAAPGAATGPVSAKSIDKVSISYDTASAAMPDAGHWNLTVYGQRFLRLLRMVGAGPIQMGAGVSPNPLSSSNAWPGPFTGPGWFS